MSLTIPPKVSPASVAAAESVVEAPRPSVAQRADTFGKTAAAAPKLTQALRPMASKDAVALLEQAKAGTVDAHAAIVRLANGAGLPLDLGDRFVFVAESKSSALFVAGDHNGWQKQPMQKHGDVFVLEIPKVRAGKYKLVQADGTFAADPAARSYGYDAHGEFSLVKGHGPHHERYIELGGHGVPPRTVRVWVPAHKSTHHLYAHDGQNLFDPKSMHGGWKLDTQVGASTLVVGIDSPGWAERFRVLTPVESTLGDERLGGGADDYADFIRDVVRPFIEERYGEPEIRGLLGSSLGGVCVLNQVRRHPHDWDFAAAMSATVWWGQDQGDSTIDRYRGKAPAKATMYVDSGGAPDTRSETLPGGKDNHDAVRELVDVMAESGYRWDDNLVHWHAPNADHSESAWSKRLHRPLAIFEQLGRK